MGAAREFLAKLTTRASLLFALAAILCGAIGYSRLPLGPGDGMSAQSAMGRVFDIAYLSIGMLSVAVKNAHGDPFLLVGRWFGVLFVFGAVVRVTLPWMGAAFTRRRIARWRGHTLVLGLGGRGLAYLRDVARLGRVVGVDVSQARLDFAGMPARVALLRGDASERRVLERANLRSAARVVVCTGDDVSDDRIARAVVAAMSVAGCGAPIELVVHFTPGGPGEALLSSLPAHTRVHPRPVAAPALAARALLARCPSLLGADRLLSGARHWVIVGWDAYAEALLLYSLRMPGLPELPRARCTIHCADPDVVHARLAARLDAATDMLDGVRVRKLDVTGGVDDESLREAEREAAVSAIFVFAARDGEAVALATRLRAKADRAGCWRAPLFVRLDDEQAFVAALAPRATVKRADAVVEAFGTLTSCCTGAALQAGAERLAQALHMSYAKRVPAGSGRSLAWSAISEGFREANRRAVDHFALKMSALGYLVRGEWPRPVKAPSLDAGTLEWIARMEHESWVAEKRVAGWISAPRRDDSRRHHDCLVSFDALAASEREKDLDAFRVLAGNVADASVLVAGAGVPAGAGAFRERIVGLFARRALTTPPEALRAALHAWLRDVGAEARLGPQDDEFWTLAVTMEPGGELLAARAACAALDAVQAAGGAARWRAVIVQSAPLALLAEPAQATSLTVEVRSNPRVEHWLVPVVGRDSPTRAEYRSATVDAILARCDDLLVVDDACSLPLPSPLPIDGSGMDIEHVVQRWREAGRRVPAGPACPRRAVQPLSPDGVHAIRPDFNK